jgi:cobalt transporter subunit CbtA
VWTAFVAAVVTGLAITLVQLFTTVPLIAKAETYEQSEPQSDEHHAAHGAAAHDHAAHDHNGWAPKDGFERTFYTGLTTVLTAFGYALMLGALLSQMRFASWRTGIALGMAGFLVFQLAPALGLPPEPPGVPMAELLPRQLWWLATVVATAAAFAAWYRARNHSKLLWIPLGAALLALPHLIGPPPAPEAPSGVPHELARDFAIASLATAALFWTMLGTVQGYLFARACRAT